MPAKIIEIYRESLLVRLPSAESLPSIARLVGRGTQYSLTAKIGNVGQIVRKDFR